MSYVPCLCYNWSSSARELTFAVARARAGYIQCGITSDERRHTNTMHAFFLADLLSGFGINLWAFLSQLVSFVIVFLILWRWGFPVIRRTLHRRPSVILEGVENPERALPHLPQAPPKPCTSF